MGGELGGGDGHGSGLHPISQAGKFGLIPTLISLGTGAAWLGVVSVESVGKHAPSPLRHGWAPEVGSGRGKAWGVGLDTAQPCCPQITFLCDLLLLYVDGEAHFYWRTKYEEVRCAWGLGAACLGLWPEPQSAAIIHRQRLQRGPPALSRQSWHPHPHARPSRGLRGGPAQYLCLPKSSDSVIITY